MSPQQKIAVRFCDDICLKIRQLRKMPAKDRERVLAGLVDSLLDLTQPHPTTDLALPPIRRAFDPGYEAGYDVGETWARIAHDWIKDVENF